MSASTGSKHAAAALAHAKLMERVEWAERAAQRAHRLRLEAHARRKRVEVLRLKLDARQQATASAAQGVAG